MADRRAGSPAYPAKGSISAAVASGISSAGKWVTPSIRLARISTQPIRPCPLPRDMPVAGGFAQVNGLGRCQAPALCGGDLTPMSPPTVLEGLARGRKALPGNGRDRHVRAELPSLSVSISRPAVPDTDR